MISFPDAELNPRWLAVIGEEFQAGYMRALADFLRREEDEGQAVYPPRSDIFNALNTTPFDDVKVVIIGQDPYHGEGQAHGLAFSVRPGVRVPPSLRNIYKELDATFGAASRANGDLTSWARQGVLLLNATLTVRRDKAGSHQNRGWEKFTNAVIHAVNDRHEHVVFMLWGSYAQKKGAFIDRAKHLVLEAPHPSPLSAHRGFLGCGHFRMANEYLRRHGRVPIDWRAEGG